MIFFALCREREFVIQANYTYQPMAKKTDDQGETFSALSGAYICIIALDNPRFLQLLFTDGCLLFQWRNHLWRRHFIMRAPRERINTIAANCCTTTHRRGNIWLPKETTSLLEGVWDFKSNNIYAPHSTLLFSIFLIKLLSALQFKSSEAKSAYALRLRQVVVKPAIDILKAADTLLHLLNNIEFYFGFPINERLD